MTVQTGRRNWWNDSDWSENPRGDARSHGVVCAQPVSVRNQQAGPDPERPAGLHEMVSERIHPAVYLVRERRAENRLGPADESRTAARANKRFITVSCAQACVPARPERTVFKYRPLKITFRDINHFMFGKFKTYSASLNAIMSRYCAMWKIGSTFLYCTKIRTLTST